MIDNFGDRMKAYEMAEAGRKLMPRLPVLVRLDGKAFHTFTKGMERPYDKKFSDLMVNTTIDLVKYTGAVMGYTQSDEISLVLYQEDPRSETFFGGRIQKLTSILAARAAVYFNSELAGLRGGSALPLFDCRVWNVPNKTEAVNALLWREQDATKNSIQMAAQSVFSHKELQRKHSSQLQEMLFQKGINWNDYPSFFKRGTYVQTVTRSIPYSQEEIARLPPKHQAHYVPNLTVKRRVVEPIKMPVFTTVINREEVVFEGAKPILLPELEALNRMWDDTNEQSLVGEP